jgi:hypothetical protein
MRRTPALLAIATAAAIGLLTSAVPGTAAPAAAPRPAHLEAVLVGGNEVPGPGDPDAFGLADVIAGGGEVCWLISVRDAERITAAHIHAGPAGVSGPVVVPLDPIRDGCAEAKGRLVRFIKQHPEQFYVNLHNDEFPNGAVRGQLLP